MADQIAPRKNEQTFEIIDDRQQQRERERGRYKRGKKMRKSQLTTRLKARASRTHKVIQALQKLRRKRAPRYNALPANMRPWVPHRKKLIAKWRWFGLERERTGDWQEFSDYARDLRALCTKAQWKDIEAEYFGGLTSAIVA